jgi:hypothetical protein
VCHRAIGLAADTAPGFDQGRTGVLDKGRRFGKLSTLPPTLRRAAKPTYSGARQPARKRPNAGITDIINSIGFKANGPTMLPPMRSFMLAALLLAAATAFSMPALAQSGDSKGGDKTTAAQAAKAAEAAKEAQRRIDEFAEAASRVSGPAGNPECVWLGRRVVGLLWRDDMDTAFRHLDLYDRFGCPGAHIQAAFRCLVRQGYIDPKSPQSLNARVHACWVNPGAPPAKAAAAPAPGSKSAGTAGK